MMPPTRYFVFLNRTGALARAAVCCGAGVAFLSMAGAPDPVDVTETDQGDFWNLPPKSIGGTYA